MLSLSSIEHLFDSVVSGHGWVTRETRKHPIQTTKFTWIVLFVCILLSVPSSARCVSTMAPPLCLRACGVSTCWAPRGVRSWRSQRRVKLSLQTIIQAASFTPPSSTCCRTTWALLASLGPESPTISLLTQYRVCSVPPDHLCIHKLVRSYFFLD